MLAGALLGPDSRRRGPVFSLVPLADVVFQLLIFFMLTAGLSAYAQLPLGAAAEMPALRSAGTASGGTASGGSAAWHVSAGHIRAGNAQITIAELPEAMALLRGLRIAEIVLFATETATVDDMTAVLEVLQGAGIGGVRLMARADAGAAP